LSCGVDCIEDAAGEPHKPSKLVGLILDTVTGLLWRVRNDRRA
jgi:hypothetical protein